MKHKMNLVYQSLNHHVVLREENGELLITVDKKVVARFDISSFYDLAKTVIMEADLNDMTSYPEEVSLIRRKAEVSMAEAFLLHAEEWMLSLRWIKKIEQKEA